MAPQGWRKPAGGAVPVRPSERNPRTSWHPSRAPPTGTPRHRSDARDVAASHHRHRPQADTHREADEEEEGNGLQFRDVLPSGPRTPWYQPRPERCYRRTPTSAAPVRSNWNAAFLTPIETS